MRRHLETVVRYLMTDEKRERNPVAPPAPEPHGRPAPDSSNWAAKLLFCELAAAQIGNLLATRRGLKLDRGRLPTGTVSTSAGTPSASPSAPARDGRPPVVGLDAEPQARRSPPATSWNSGARGRRRPPAPGGRRAAAPSARRLDGVGVGDRAGCSGDRSRRTRTPLGTRRRCPAGRSAGTGRRCRTPRRRACPARRRRTSRPVVRVAGLDRRSGRRPRAARCGRGSRWWRIPGSPTRRRCCGSARHRPPRRAVAGRSNWHAASRNTRIAPSSSAARSVPVAAAASSYVRSWEPVIMNAVGRNSCHSRRCSAAMSTRERRPDGDLQRAEREVGAPAGHVRRVDRPAASCG